MKVQVSSVNEHKFYPDAYGNLDLPEKERFCIVIKKTISILSAKDWVEIDEDDNTKVDLKASLNDRIIKLVNPWVLVVDRGTKKEKEIELTKAIILSEEYSELSDVVIQLLNETTKIATVEGERVKK